MLNFRKVKPGDQGDNTKEDQRKYAKKVMALRIACDNFKKYLEEKVDGGHQVFRDC